MKKKIKLTEISKREMKHFKGGDPPLTCDCSGASCGGPENDGTNIQGVLQGAIATIDSFPQE